MQCGIGPLAAETGTSKRRTLLQSTSGSSEASTLAALQQAFGPLVPENGLDFYYSTKTGWCSNRFLLFHISNPK